VTELEHWMVIFTSSFARCKKNKSVRAVAFLPRILVRIWLSRV